MVDVGPEMLREPAGKSGYLHGWSERAIFPLSPPRSAARDHPRMLLECLLQQSLRKALSAPMPELRIAEVSHEAGSAMRCPSCVASAHWLALQPKL